MGLARRDHPEVSAEGQASKADAEKADGAVADRVQKAVDEETEQGFRGIKVDPLPNSAYSLESGPESPAVGSTGRLPQVDVADITRS